MAADAREEPRYGLLIAAFVVAATATKLMIAATTLGTDDMLRWADFARGIAEHGAYGIYGVPFGTVYNHPPVTGLILVAVNTISGWGVPFDFALRSVAIAADVVTPFVLFELLRTRSTLPTAFIAAASVAISPVLVMISGFHGNTDPLFVMLVMLSVYLLVDRRAAFLAGLALGAALGVKIVAGVFVPALATFAVITGAAVTVRFLAGAAAIVAITWVPILFAAWRSFLDQVFGYEGGIQVWGLGQIGRWFGDPGWATWLRGPGRFLVVAIASIAPAIWVRRRPHQAAEASALAIAGFLVLSPAFGVQYLAWVVAPAFLLSVPFATAYGLAASGLLFAVYTRWSGGFPWHAASSRLFTTPEAIGAFGVWCLLVVIVVRGYLLPSRRPASAVPVPTDAMAEVPR
jgi:hypothetical protein